MSHPTRALVRRTALVALLLLVADPAAATLLAYEPFDYAPGTQLAGVPATGTNLTGSWVGYGGSEPYRLTVVSGGAGYGALSGAPTTSGGRVTDTIGATAGGARIDLASPIAIAPGETIYWSALMTFDDSSNGNHLASVSFLDDTSSDSITFGEPVVGARNIRVATSTSASGGQVALGGDDLFDDGDTFLLIGRYHNDAAPGADSLELIGYDTSGATELPVSFDPSDPAAAFFLPLTNLDIDMERIGRLELEIRGSSNNFIDELRIGTAYASVVPEPSTGVLVGLGLLGIARCGRWGRRFEGSASCRRAAHFMHVK